MNDEQPRTVTASTTGGRPSDYMLDNFVAHKLSLLTACGAPEFTHDENWLGGAAGYPNGNLPRTYNCLPTVIPSVSPATVYRKPVVGMR